MVPVSFGSELRWAWRNVRARRWRAALTVALLGAALAANTVLFSVADSAVFHRIPYDAPERLVEIQQQHSGGRRDGFMSVALFDQWRQQTDLFSGVHGYLSKNLFLAGSDEPEFAATADVTVGLIEMVGARPRWGRSFTAGDERQLDLQPVLIAQPLATERFGDPAAAVGKQLETTGEPLLVIGVMPPDFHFPDGRARIWRALDPRGPLARGFVGVSSIARLAPGMSVEIAAELMASRSDAVAAAAGAKSPYLAQPGPLRAALTGTEQRRLFLLLLGAAACLLLIACANVASLELATAMDRARASAIQLALGASRGVLARTAALEGLLLLVLAASLAGLLAHFGTEAIARLLPAVVTRWGANPIDFDTRALMFMLAAGAAAWMLSSVPIIVFAARGNLVPLLKTEGHGVSASTASSRVRRTLTAAEVALAVMLLVGGLAYVRSYQELLAQEKGFDSSGVVTISLTIPPQMYAAPGEKLALRERVLERVRSTPGVLVASGSSAPPFMGAGYAVRRMEIDDRPPVDAHVTIAELHVEPDYFSVLRIPLIAGRMFEPGDLRTDVIVSETFANRYWPGQDAIGRSYRRDPGGPWRRVIGVAGHIRTEYDPPGARNADILQTYYLQQPPPPPVAPSRPPVRATGGSFSFLNLMARVDSKERLADLHRAIRAIDSAFILRLDFVDDVYARQYEDRLLATRIVGGFGILAFLIAAAGIYGVMSFLVAHRIREIGIRVALGASGRDITQLVVGSSLKLVLAGAVAGIGAAAVVARWIQSQLYGVHALDPSAVLAVACGVVVISLLATWRPTNRATRVDPSVLLRG